MDVLYYGVYNQPLVSDADLVLNMDKRFNIIDG